MNAPEPLASVFANDREIIEEIESLLPQQSVRFLGPRIVQDGVYDRPFADNFTRLTERFGEVGFQPRDSKLKKAFRLFKKRFLALDNVLQEEFGLDPRRQWLSIHPNRKQQADYGELIKLLRRLYNNFEVSYFAMLKAAVAIRESPMELVSNNLPASTVDARIKISFDLKKGIYIDEDRRYSISGMRLECVKRLLDSESLTSEDLREYWHSSSQISNEIRKINELVRRKLKIKTDLIVYSKTAGFYHLNRDEIDISTA